MSEEEEKHFQLSNTCCICEKLINDDDEKARDHCHRTGKFKGTADWSCNMNLRLAKKFPIIFQNLRGYDSHLIFYDINNLIWKLT